MIIFMENLLIEEEEDKDKHLTDDIVTMKVIQKILNRIDFMVMMMIDVLSNVV